MTTIPSLVDLPALPLWMHSAKDETDALRIADGRKAWAYCNALGNWIVFVVLMGDTDSVKNG
jgi:hypothetical protein